MKIVVGEVVKPKPVIGVLNLTSGIWRNENCKDAIVFVGDTVQRPGRDSSHYIGIVVYEKGKLVNLSNECWEKHAFFPVHEILTITPTE